MNINQHIAQAIMNANDPSNPAVIVCASTAETGVTNSFLGGPSDPSEVALRVYAASSSAAGAVKSSEVKKCAAASSPTATYNSESDDDDEGGTMPWDRQGWIPRTKSGKQKTPNMVGGRDGAAI